VALCFVWMTVDFPRLQIIDVRTDDMPMPELWAQLNIPDINLDLQTPPPSVRLPVAQQNEQELTQTQPLQRLISVQPPTGQLGAPNLSGRWQPKEERLFDLGCNEKATDLHSTVVHVCLENPSLLSADWQLEVPNNDDTVMRKCHWADPGTIRLFSACKRHMMRLLTCPHSPEPAHLAMHRSSIRVPTAGSGDTREEALLILASVRCGCAGHRLQSAYGDQLPLRSSLCGRV